jgi:HKD family nuclease
MLLTRDSLIDRFYEHLKQSKQIDVAVASDCDALTSLCTFAMNAPMRAIVGIRGNATHPNALRAILRYGQLRIPKNVERLFHPKFYLFHQQERQIGWIGSANLTRPGFQLNDELVFEFEDDGKARQWFDQLWSSLAQDCSSIVDNYEENWVPPPPPPQRPLDHPQLNEPNDVYRAGRELRDWPSFVAGISEADRYWRDWSKNEKNPFSVVGDGVSWLETITLGCAVVRRNDWSELSKEDRFIILGRDRYGLLGSMIGAGKANQVFKAATPEHLRIRRAIRTALQPAIDAADHEFADAASSFLEAVNQIPGFGGAIATRLLALARPDRAVSVNDGSKEHLAQLTGLPPNSLSHAPHGRARSYIDLLRWFEDQEWYSNPTPKGPYERSLANARAALIDSFVYEPV